MSTVLRLITLCHRPNTVSLAGCLAGTSDTAQPVQVDNRQCLLPAVQLAQGRSVTQKFSESTVSSGCLSLWPCSEESDLGPVVQESC